MKSEKTVYSLCNTINKGQLSFEMEGYSFRFGFNKKKLEFQQIPDWSYSILNNVGRSSETNDEIAKWQRNRKVR
jgi:hypothetical protein